MFHIAESPKLGGYFVHTCCFVIAQVNKLGGERKDAIPGIKPLHWSATDCGSRTLNTFRTFPLKTHRVATSPWCSSRASMSIRKYRCSELTVRGCGFQGSPPALLPPPTMTATTTTGDGDGSSGSTLHNWLDVTMSNELSS